MDMMGIDGSVKLWFVVCRASWQVGDWKFEALAKVPG